MAKIRLMEKKYLTRAEFSEAVFQAIKAELKSRGFSLWLPNFDPDYPISLRQVNFLRRGSWRFSTLQSLPGIHVEEFFTLETPTMINQDEQPMTNQEPG